MRTLQSAGLAVVVYAILAFFLFGDVLAPVGLLLIFSDRLGAPYWQLLVLASIVCAAIAAFWSVCLLVVGRLAVFVGLTMIFSYISVGFYAEWLKREKVSEFAADTYIQESFFRSIRNVPRDFQFFLHAAALKNCTPYAWSYRTMSFYQLPPDVAVNVLPWDWVSRCGIERTSR